MSKKIIVAYSGGLDTSVLLLWLKNYYNAEVIAYCADVGQAEELDGLEEKALNTGASKCFIGDLKDEFAKDYIFPMFQAGAIYEGKYWLGTSIARPVITKGMIDIAKQEGATSLAHGATGKGNDQVRFELSAASLAPDMEMIAPWRMAEFREQFPGRAEMISYAEKEGIAWTLIPYVSGGMLSKDEASLKSLGVALSRMSLIPAADCFPREYRMGFSLFDKVLKSKSEKVDREFIEILSSEVSNLKSVIPENLPLGVLHGDLFPDNVIGSDGGEVLAILDLEEAWIGPRAFDLAMAFVGFGWEDGKPVEKSWKALVDGYQSISELSQAEISALPILHRFATLSIACWRYWKHNLTAPDVSLSERYVEMVERLSVEFDFSGAFE